MAKISKATPKNLSGSYNRLFGSDRLGLLMSKIQSTVISNGTELEKILISKIKEKHTLVKNVYGFLFNKQQVEKGIYLITKKDFQKASLKHSQLKNIGQRPDFIIIVSNYEERKCLIIELKDGHVFDTKKMIGERNLLEKFCDKLGKLIPFQTVFFICAFNQNDKNVIRTGMKNKFKDSEIKTGREFCKIFGIDYDEIIKIRRKDAEENLKYFFKQVEEIKKLEYTKYSTK